MIFTSPYSFWLSNTKLLMRTLSAWAMLIFAMNLNAYSQDQFVFYFPGSTAGVGEPGSFTFDNDGNFWAIGRSPVVAPVPVPRISKLSDDGSGWTADPHVLDEDLAFFYRSVDLSTGLADASLGGPSIGTPASFLLNPAPLTLTIPTGTGGFTQETYQPGELAFVSDAMSQIAEPDGTPILSATKKIYRYDLRKVDNPNGTGVSGPTTQQPDFANAGVTNGVNTVTFGSAGFTDFNDAFSVVFSEQDLQDAVVASLTADFNSNVQVGSADLQVWQDNYGNAATKASGDANGNGQAEGSDFLTWQRQFGLRDGGSDNFGRSFAWSSDGQSIYAIDAGSNTGGIYRIDATQQNAGTRIWTDTRSIPDVAGRIISEPAVTHTSVRDFDPANQAIGDQIIVEGSLAGGNEGGVNVFTDTGDSTVHAPTPLFSRADFSNFAEYLGDSAPQYLSLTTDSIGNLYFHEGRTDGVYVYDTAGRFAKVASEAEHNLFQFENGSGPNDNVLDMQVRASTLPGFLVNEIIFTDDGLDTPVGILVYKTGDFDRDDDVDSADLGLFAAALGTRGLPAEAENNKFDLNGNAELVFDAEDMRFEHVSNGAVVVDWKDVKILQQFTNISDGDANLDGAIDYLDLDIMSANYFTISGQNEETWVDGDFASIDPAYAIDAADANLVNLVDLEVIADTWVNLLGQLPVTEADAEMRGYVGQFRTDLLAAFASMTVLGADFNGDMLVDTTDLLIWETNFGLAANSSTGDANGDGFATGADFLLWQQQVNSSGNALAAASAIVPEPNSFSIVIVYLVSALAFSQRCENSVRRHYFSLEGKVLATSSWLLAARR